MVITLSQVKNTLQAHAQNTKRPEYTNYAIRSVYSAILGGIDHPLMDLVIQGQSDAVASAGKKEAYTAKVDLSSRLVRNRIAAEETLAIGENSFVGECKKHGYAKFYVYEGRGYACATCKKNAQVLP